MIIRPIAKPNDSMPWLSGTIIPHKLRSLVMTAQCSWHIMSTIWQHVKLVWCVDGMSVCCVTTFLCFSGADSNWRLVTNNWHALARSCCELLRCHAPPLTNNRYTYPVVWSLVTRMFIGAQHNVPLWKKQMNFTCKHVISCDLMWS
jgi:hypothetical protein